jgi:hypothetical protein
MNHQWASRVTLAVSVLKEKTISGLEALRAHTNEILPFGGFNPSLVIADPAPLVRDAEECAKTYRAGVQMNTHFEWLLRLGPVFVIALIASEFGVAALTAHYGDLLTWPWLRAAGFAVFGIAVLLVLGAGATYIFLQHRLAGAEILAGTGGREGMEDIE